MLCPFIASLDVGCLRYINIRQNISVSIFISSFYSILKFNLSILLSQVEF